MASAGDDDENASPHSLDLHNRALRLFNGLLRIDVIDPKSGHILWRGKGTHRGEQHWKPETKIEKIDELVDKVLAQFPPTSNPLHWGT